MKLLFIIISIFTGFCCFGQKQNINDSSFRSWTSVDEGALSDDGRFACYRTNNLPLGSHTYSVVSTSKKWQKSVIGAENVNFSADSKYLLFTKNNTLTQLFLNSEKTEQISGCETYRMISVGKTNWIVYKLMDSENTLVAKNLFTNNAIRIRSVQNFYESKNAFILLKIKENDQTKCSLTWLDLKSGKRKVIYEGSNPEKFIFDESGSKVAFTDMELGIRSILYFDGTLNHAIKIATDHSDGILLDHNIETEPVWKFSNDGKSLFFTQAKKRLSDNITEGKPAIWNYQDAYLLSRYKVLGGQKGANSGTNLSFLNIKEKTIKKLLSGPQRLLSSPDLSNDFLLVQSAFADLSEGDWNPFAQVDYFLCFIKTGEMLPVKLKSKHPISFHVSPDKKCLFYYDETLNGFFTYTIKSRETKMVSANKPVLKRSDQVYWEDYRPAEFVGWVKGKNQVILRGKFDLWVLDLENKPRLMNLTMSQGERNRVVFNLLDEYSNKIVNLEGQIILEGFNNKTKENAFYSLDFDNKKIQRIYHDWDSVLFRRFKSTGKIRCIKSKNSSSYLVLLESSRQSPNYFYTKDFRKLTLISNNAPEKTYRWIRSELVTYKDNADNSYDAVVYKPENFDSSRKYPVIFQYYRNVSDELNVYISPEPKLDGINIPLFVSKGYIVVRPDIRLSMGNPGEGPFQSVMAAADFMGSLSWVDSTKMGLSGHSWGGFETNYIVSHSTRFAAALSGASISNMVQGYNELWGDAGTSIQSYIKGMGFQQGLDADPSLYLKNSPILFSKYIQTPLLLLHNQGDMAVNVSQSIQLFVQLRSLRKPVWLLQYPGEDHAIYFREINRLDYQTRTLEFFDHFLKNRAAPSWMLDHIRPEKSQ